MKLFAVLLLVSALGSGVYYVVGLAQDRERLAAGLETATSANETYIHAMAEMERMHQATQQQIAERDQRNRQIQRRLNKTSEALRHAKQSQAITTVERECMDSVIPAAVADILRETTGSGDADRTDTETVSSVGAVLASLYAPIHWQHLDRPGQLYQSFAGRVFEIAGRPASDSGVL